MKEKSDISPNLADLRREYLQAKLVETEVAKDPIHQLTIWLNDAIRAEVPEPNAMALATSTFEGKPSVRMVLLKDLSSEGLVFFTSYESKKARHLLQNPYAALTLYWSDLERQVRVEGVVRKIPAEQSDSYFEIRPERSKLGAWASPQSSVVPSRRYIEQLVKDFEEEFEGKTVVRPENWGGYVVEPSLVEFWQGREDRLHDRIQYRKDNDRWVIERLAP